MRIKAFEIANCFLYSKEQKRTTFMVHSDHLRLSCSIQTWIKNRRAINKAINKLVHMLSFQCVDSILGEFVKMFERLIVDLRQILKRHLFLQKNNF